MGLFAVFGPVKTIGALAILIGASLRVSDRGRTHHGECGRGVRSTRARGRCRAHRSQRASSSYVRAMAGDERPSARSTLQAPGPAKAKYRNTKQ